MDASTYGRMVEQGGYATGGVVQSSGFTLVGEHGPEPLFVPRGGYIQPAGLVSRSDTSVTLVTNPETSAQVSAMLQRAFRFSEIRIIGGPDDGSAGVPAKV